MPGAGVADDIAIGWARQHRALPESVRQRLQSERLEKPFAVLHDLFRRGLALLQDLADIVSGRRGGRRDQIVDVAPFLRPHVPQQVRRNHAIASLRGGAILLNQLAANVGVQLVIKRLDLFPDPLQLGGKLFGGHVVTRAPEHAGVGESQFARTGLRRSTKRA